MEVIEVIHADKYGNEINSINHIVSFDAVVDLDGYSDWILKLPVEEWSKYPVAIDDYIYIPNTEWGGVVSHIKTQGIVVELSGKMWREILNKNIVKPPTGQAYNHLNGEATDIIRQIISNHFEDIIKIVDGEPIIVNYLARYEPIGKCINTALERKGGCISITKKESVEISVRKYRDLSKDYELSEDVGAIVTIEEDESKKVNHIVALGRGVLEQRMVVEAWCLTDGTIVYESDHKHRPRGLKEKTYVLDYPNVESKQELVAKIQDVFKERQRITKASIDLQLVSDIGLNLGDIVGVRDRRTNSYKKSKVIRQIIKINQSGGRLIRYEVKGN